MAAKKRGATADDRAATHSFGAEELRLPDGSSVWAVSPAGEYRALLAEIEAGTPLKPERLSIVGRALVDGIRHEEDKDRRVQACLKLEGEGSELQRLRRFRDAVLGGPGRRGQRYVMRWVLRDWNHLIEDQAVEPATALERVRKMHAFPSAQACARYLQRAGPTTCPIRGR